MFSMDRSRRHLGNRQWRRRIDRRRSLHAAGARLHAIAEEGVTLCAIAQAIGAGLGVPVRSLAKDEARAHFDWLAGLVAIDNPTSSALTREALGWSPKEFGLLTDMKESGYFSSPYMPFHAR
jgi:hypothetical protein